MKKPLLIIVIIATVLITSAVVWAFSPKKNLKPSEYNIGTTYELAIKDKKPIIALFYADWCTYCMRFMPKYKIIADVYKNKYNLVMIDAENPKYATLVKDYSIEGFPTMYIIDPNIDNRISLSNNIYDDLGKLRIEFDRYLRIRSMIK
ncbi:MAG: protein disulfide isomerase family protein [bacterium]